MLNYCPKCGSKIVKGANHCAQCGIDLNYIKKNKAEKINEVFKQKPGLSRKNFVNITLIILFGFSFIFYFASDKSNEESIIEKQPDVAGSVSYPLTGYSMKPIVASVMNGYIILPLQEVLDKKFVRFTYAGAAEIPLLAYINENGTLITSISLCEPCNSTTFHIKNDELICNSCGTTWDLNNLEAISGSCGKYPPDPIPSTVVGDEIRIKETVVKNWQRRV